jgi:hypothetical protein
VRAFLKTPYFAAPKALKIQQPFGANSLFRNDFPLRRVFENAAAGIISYFSVRYEI